MANTKYTLVRSLREKKANTSAGISAPTAQPVKPITPDAGMPGSGPLQLGGAAGAQPGGGLGGGGKAPPGFVAGMNQQNQENQLEQQKAMGQMQGDMQTMQEKQLQQQQVAQQKELQMQGQMQQETLKKDLEVQKLQVQLEAEKQKNQVAQSAKEHTPGVSTYIPSKSKTLASKANSLLKGAGEAQRIESLRERLGESKSACIGALMLVTRKQELQDIKDAELLKSAFDYNKALDESYGGAKTPMVGTKSPTSLAQGRMYNHSATNAAPQSRIEPPKEFQYGVQNGQPTATYNNFTTQLPSQLAAVTPLPEGQTAQNVYAGSQYVASQRGANTVPQHIPASDQFSVFQTQTDPTDVNENPDYKPQHTYQAFDPEGYNVTFQGNYTTPAEAREAARQQYLQQYGSTAQGYNYATPIPPEQPVEQKQFFPEKMPEFGEFKQDIVTNDEGKTLVKMTAPDGRSFTITPSLLAKPEVADAQVRSRYKNILRNEWLDKANSGEDLSQYAAPAEGILSGRPLSDYQKSLLDQETFTPDSIPVYKTEGGDIKAKLPTGVEIDVPSTLPAGTDAQQYAYDVAQSFKNSKPREGLGYGNLAEHADYMKQIQEGRQQVLNNLPTTPELKTQWKRWAEKGDADKFDTWLNGLDTKYFDAPEEFKTYYEQAQENSKHPMSQGFLSALKGTTRNTDDPRELAEFKRRYMEDPVGTLSDPRYYDHRSIQKWLLNKTGLGAMTEMEKAQLKASPNLDPGKDWFSLNDSWNPKDWDWKAPLEKIQPFIKKRVSDAGAVADAGKNFVREGILGRGSSFIKNWGEGQDTIMQHGLDSPNMFMQGAGQIGNAFGDLGHMALNTTTAFLPASLVARGGTVALPSILSGGPKWGFTGAAKAGWNPLTSSAWAGRYLPFAANTGLYAGTSAGVNALSSPEDSMSWSDKAKALEMGLDPDSPTFYDDYVQMLQDSGGTDMAGTQQTTTTNTTDSYTPTGPTDAMTLQDTGYLHPDKFNNSFASQLPPGMIGAFLNAVTPQTYMPPPQQFTPGGMMGAFNNAATAFGTPPAAQSYNAMRQSLGNTF